MYVCVKGMIRDKTGLDRLGWGQIMKSFVCWVKRSGLDSVGSKNHWCIFNKLETSDLPFKKRLQQWWHGGLISLSLVGEGGEWGGKGGDRHLFAEYLLACLLLIITLMLSHL